MRYKPDRNGIKTLARSREVGAACVAAANRGRDWARSLPLQGDPDAIARYRDGFRVEPTSVTVAGESRAGALLINDSDVERIFGARNRVLFRAISQIEGASIR